MWHILLNYYDDEEGSVFQHQGTATHKSNDGTSTTSPSTYTINPCFTLATTNTSSSIPLHFQGNYSKKLQFDISKSPPPPPYY